MVAALLSRYDVAGAFKFLQLSTYAATVSYKAASDPVVDCSHICTHR